MSLSDRAEFASSNPNIREALEVRQVKYAILIPSYETFTHFPTCYTGSRADACEPVRLDKKCDG